MKVLPRDKDRFMVQGRQNFIDWLKAVGMFLIVFGHVFGQPFEILAPIYPKQLGVALFVFVMGWGLANDRRKGGELFFCRVFPIFFYGIVCAVLYSLIAYGTKNNLALSNYLPFFGGVNVLLNHFPANPTTWYIGTYMHLVLLWVFLAGPLRKGWQIVLVCLIIEIVSRSAVMATGNLFIAYMLLTNWLTLFALGIYWHEKRDSSERKLILPLGVATVLVPLIWGNNSGILTFDDSFPFMQLPGQGVSINSLLGSVCISALYLVYTVLFFQLFRRVPAGNFIRFLSRNTLIIFLGHMPLIKAFHSSFYSLFDNEFTGRASFVLVVYLGLALASEFINKIAALEKIRNALWAGMNRWKLLKSNG